MTALILLLLPLVVAVPVYVLHRLRPLSTLLAAGFALAVGAVLLLVPFGETISLFGQQVVLGGETALLGRTVALGPATKLAMALLFLSGGVLFLLDWQTEKESLLAPMGVGLLGLLGGVLLVRPLIYAALLLEIVAALMIFPLHANPRSPVRAGLRYLTFFTLALPGLMVSHWLLDMYAVAPERTGLLTTATVLIGFSFAMLLGLTPFHPWVPAAGRDGSPLSAAFLFSTIGGAVWFLLLDYVRAYPWLTASAQWSAVMSTLGVVTAVTGGMLATAHCKPGRLMGYAVLVDTGLMVVALMQGGRPGIELALTLLFARPWSLALMATGIGGLRARSDDLGRDPDGLGRRAPWSTIALTIGTLSMVGFPGTVGFVPRWGLFRLLVHSDPLMALLLLLISAAPLVGLLRLLYQLLETPPRPLSRLDGEAPAEEAPPPAEGFLFTILVALLVVCVFGLGLFPHVLTDAATRLGAFFGP